jgi:hypothetical protein
MRRMKIIKEKIEQREKKERECYNNRDKGNKRRYRKRGGRMVRKGPFKINKDKMMLKAGSRRRTLC